MAVAKSEPVPIYMELSLDMISRIYSLDPTGNETLQEIIEALVNDKQRPVSLDAALVACDVLAGFFEGSYARHGIDARAAYEIEAVLADIRATLTEGGRRP